MASSPAVRIRLAAVEDVPTVLDLLGGHGSERRATDDAEAVARAVRTRAVMVATASGDLVGCVIAGFDGWRGSMYRLTVDAAYRRLGVATALVRAAERRLAKRGCRRITILADRDDPAAIAFWQSAGYTLDLALVRAVKDLPVST